MRLGDYANAVELYRSVLKGMYATDCRFPARPRTGTSQQQRLRRRAHDARYAVFHKSTISARADADLLRARVLEALGENDAALEHYRTLAISYPGEEARFRYGVLLKARGSFADARGVFRDMLVRAKNAPRYYKRKEGDWLEAAKRELASLGPG